VFKIASVCKTSFCATACLCVVASVCKMCVFKSCFAEKILCVRASLGKSTYVYIIASLCKGPFLCAKHPCLKAPVFRSSCV